MEKIGIWWLWPDTGQVGLRGPAAPQPIEQQEFIASLWKGLLC